MILLFTIACLNIATVFTITVFEKFRKINTHSTEKELETMSYVLDKNLLNNFFQTLCLDI